MTAIRKGQLITTFGPGALYVDERGVSMLISGIDHWFGRGSKQIDECKLEDDRLATRLGVDHFRLPPEHVETEDARRKPLPAFRFPAWHVCGSCNRLQRISPLVRKTPDCEQEGCKGRLHQVRFVAACSHGHIHDFPWREWVHKQVNVSCRKPMRLTGSGGSLASLWVSCECGVDVKRSLAGITRFEDKREGSRSELTDSLAPGESFTCDGSMPWLGSAFKEEGGCGRPLVGILRQATNLHFPRLVSSLKIPVEAAEGLVEVVDILESSISKKARPWLKAQLEDEEDHDELLQELRDRGGPRILDFDSQTLLKAAGCVLGDGGEVKQESVPGDSEETAHRRQERNILISDVDRTPIRSWSLNMQRFEQNSFNLFFSTVSRVERLTETRALQGFDRLVSGQRSSGPGYYPTICRNIPEKLKNRWFPALRVYGEGIYVELDEKRLSEWESRNEDWLSKRISGLRDRAHDNPIINFDVEIISPRYILVHTLSHILINSLIFECGYSTASLRERLYVSSEPDAPMTGVLIYTAAGDTEGSLGGLMSMSKPDMLIPITMRALSDATWCSSDPVCTETSRMGGQGPGSLNLAACHGCALLPETSCEHMNMLLDRRLLVSETQDGSGFFDGLFEE